MPSHGWHEKKKSHNFDTCQYLGRSPNAYTDWEVITLFYSALHYVDSFLAKAYSIDPYDHWDRRNLVRSYLAVVERSYRILYHLSVDARYNQVPIRQTELRRAHTYYRDIKLRLTPVVCSQCGYENLINKGVCDNCGKVI